MNLTKDDLKDRVLSILEVVTRINIYKNNLEMILDGPVSTKMPELHFNQLLFDISRLLIIDISQLIKESKNECLNFYTLKKSLAMNPHRYVLDLTELDKHKGKLDLLIKYRDHKYAHSDPSKVLENIKFSEIYPLVDSVNNVFEDLCKHLVVDFNKSSYEKINETYNFHQYFYNALHSGDLKIYYRD